MLGHYIFLYLLIGFTSMMCGLLRLSCRQKAYPVFFRWQAFSMKHLFSFFATPCLWPEKPGHSDSVRKPMLWCKIIDLHSKHEIRNSDFKMAISQSAFPKAHPRPALLIRIFYSNAESIPEF